MADLIVTNAKVWTVDSSRPSAEAVAVLGDRIVVVGSNSSVDGWRGPKTTIIDAKGKLLVPGFNDSHVHFVDGGRQLENAQLNDAVSAEEMARRIVAPSFLCGSRSSLHLLEKSRLIEIDAL